MYFRKQNWNVYSASFHIIIIKCFKLFISSRYPCGLRIWVSCEKHLSKSTLTIGANLNLHITSGGILMTTFASPGKIFPILRTVSQSGFLSNTRINLSLYSSSRQSSNKSTVFTASDKSKRPWNLSSIHVTFENWLDKYANSLCRRRLLTKYCKMTIARDSVLSKLLHMKLLSNSKCFQQ